MGRYTKGYLNFNRSSSNEAGVSKKMAGAEIYGSPNKPAVYHTNVPASSPVVNRKPGQQGEVKKPDLFSQNVMMSPSAGSGKKKGAFGFFGMKFLSKNNTKA